MFRFANENDRESLLMLWNSCFGDGEKYVYPFLDTFLKEDNVYIFEDVGKAVSAVYALDCKIGKYKGIYFYAVATDENYRRQGLAKKEIEFLIDYKTKKGTDVFLLTPSNEKNRSYYKTLGFEDFFYCGKKAFSKGDEKSRISEDFSADELFELREKGWEETEFVSFPKEHFSFALRFSERIFTEKEDGKITAYALVDGKKITELYAGENREKFVSAILEKIDAEQAEVYIPVTEKYKSDSCKIPRGMIYCSNKDLTENLSENTFLSLNLE